MFAPCLLFTIVKTESVCGFLLYDQNGSKYTLEPRTLSYLSILDAKWNKKAINFKNIWVFKSQRATKKSVLLIRGACVFFLFSETTKTSLIVTRTQFRARLLNRVSAHLPPI